MAASRLATSVTPKPARCAFSTSTRKLTAGPITKFWFTTSTTPLTLGSHSSTAWATALVDRGVGVKDLDLDGLGRIGQVADQVLEDVGELDVDRRLGPHDLVAELGS